MGLALLILTVGLVAAGCITYAVGWVGWAQFLWVVASGTAGAGVAFVVDRRGPP